MPTSHPNLDNHLLRLHSHLILCFMLAIEIITTVKRITALDHRRTCHVPSTVHERQRKLALAAEVFEMLNKNVFVSLISYALD